MIRERIDNPSGLPGLRLALLHEGHGTGRAVLFVHGASFPSDLAAGYPFDGGSWMDALALEGFDVWALDFLGYGHSSRYPEMRAPAEANPPLGRASDAAQQIATAVAFIRGPGHARVSLEAHSWGTLPAGRFASENPEIIERLVLFGPLGVPPLVEPPASDQRLPAWVCVSAQDQRDRFRGWVPRGEGQVFEEHQLSAWLQAYLESDLRSAERTPPCVQVPNGPEADFEALERGERLYDPSRISAPVLIVRGEWDLASPDAEVRPLFRALTAAQVKLDVVLGRGTHVMHLETNRRALYEATRAFLAEPDPRMARGQ